jgi:hypothetical protein
MSPDQERRLEEISSAARDLAPLEQAAFLERACGGHLELRRKADSLLAAHEQAGRLRGGDADDLGGAAPKRSTRLSPLSQQKLGTVAAKRGADSTPLEPGIHQRSKRETR